MPQAGYSSGADQPSLQHRNRRRAKVRLVWLVAAEEIKEAVTVRDRRSSERVRGEGGDDVQRFVLNEGVIGALRGPFELAIPDND